jgi:hypothetical protein
MVDMVGRRDAWSKYGDAGEADDDDELNVGDRSGNSEVMDFIACVPGDKCG